MLSSNPNISAVTQPQADSESADSIRNTATNNRSNERAKWESVRTFISRLTIERDEVEIRGCVKRRGLVLFDIIVVFTEFIEQSLMWAKRELGKEVESNG